jgi:hypothetical protein
VRLYVDVHFGGLLSIFQQESFTSDYPRGGLIESDVRDDVFYAFEI